MNETIGVSLQILPIPVDRSVSGIKQDAQVKVIMPEDYRERGWDRITWEDENSSFALWLSPKRGREKARRAYVWPTSSSCARFALTWPKRKALDTDSLILPIVGSHRSQLNYLSSFISLITLVVHSDVVRLGIRCD